MAQCQHRLYSGDGTCREGLQQTLEPTAAYRWGGRQRRLMEKYKEGCFEGKSSIHPLTLISGGLRAGVYHS
jgi:hypothetical protein